MKPARGAPATPSPPPPPPALLSLLLVSLVAATLLPAALAQAQTAEKTKRQIFREQVLPQRGGKIPEEAFRVDRLALNRLNKDGIAVPDGVLLDARRRAQHHPRHNSDLERSVVKVLVTPEGRYAAPEGRLQPQRPLTVASTYIIRPPIGSHHHPPPAVGRPLPGPPLHIPTLNLLGRQPHHRQPPPQPQSHQQLQLYPAPAPAPGPGHGRPQHPPPAPLASAPLPSLSALSGASTSFQDSFNGLFPTAGLDDFDLLVAQLNARAEREAARIASGHSAGPASASGPALAAAAAGGGPPSWPVPVDCGPPPPPHAPPRLLADPARCQVFHVCQRDGRRDTFLCPSGTLFSTALGRCDWWYNVRC